jgi:UPF0755 protein
MKKVVLIVLLVILVGAGIMAWLVIGPGTDFKGEKESLYIRTNAANKQAVLDSLAANGIIKNKAVFNFLANRMQYWTNIKPGKYDIKKGSSTLAIIRMLRNGQQTPVNLIITKLRTKEDLARLAGNKFEFDSADMIRYIQTDLINKGDADTNTALAYVLPDTYTFFWNTTPEKVFKKLSDETNKFWTAERQQKAQAKGLTPVQAYTLASIVEEETNAQAEKGNIASVYLNRIKIGMPLQADPTVKFALKDFGLRRIYEKHLMTESPFNTYRNRGLPPGPICTPTKKTIDAVLNAPTTNYIYFVASPQFNGTHEFSATYTEHLQKAKAYQQALNQRGI